MGVKAKFAKNVNIVNKKANFEYHILEKYTAGIQLKGTEIKSIRNSKANINDAFGIMMNGELWMKAIHISPYDAGSYNNHIEKRDRKLLLNSAELAKIEKKTKDKGITIVPIKLFISDKGYAKLIIGIGQGKKLYDKREDLKLKDAKRDMDRVKKV